MLRKYLSIFLIIVLSCNSIAVKADQDYLYLAQRIAGLSATILGAVLTYQQIKSTIEYRKHINSGDDRAYEVTDYRKKPKSTEGIYGTVVNSIKHVNNKIIESARNIGLYAPLERIDLQLLSIWRSATYYFAPSLADVLEEMQVSNKEIVLSQVEDLIKNNYVNLNKPGVTGKTALEIAHEWGNKGLLLKLIKLGAAIPQDVGDGIGYAMNLVDAYGYDFLREVLSKENTYWYTIFAELFDYYLSYECSENDKPGLKKLSDAFGCDMKWYYEWGNRYDDLLLISIIKGPEESERDKILLDIDNLLNELESNSNSFMKFKFTDRADKIPHAPVEFKRFIQKRQNDYQKLYAKTN